MFASTQAIVVLVVFVLSGIAAFVTIIVNQGFTALIAKCLLFSIFIIALTVYDTHCLTAGNCTEWSWIRTVLYTLIPIIVLILWIFFGSFGDAISTSGNDGKRKKDKSVK